MGRPGSCIGRAARLSLVALVASLALAPPPAHAAFPGHAGRIAFTTFRDGNSEIYSMNADASGQTRLTNNAAYDTDPAWSAHGTEIAFASDRPDNSGYPDIFVMNGDGSDVRNLTNTAAPMGEVDPAWSPDGSKIVYSGGSPSGIWVMNADGTAKTRLTTGWTPAWSPDGTKIAFGATPPLDSYSEIFVMNPDGSGITALTNCCGDHVHPDWSPDGSRIAFTEWGQDDDANPCCPATYVMNADGSGKAFVTGGGDGVWSPDGTRIAVAGLVTVNPDGTGRNALSSGDPEDNPSWQPLNLDDDLSVAKRGAPNPLVVGQTLTYTITTANNGSQAMTGVRLADQLPSGVSFGGATSSQGSCSKQNDTLSCHIGTLAGGASATVTLEVKPTSYGAITNTVSGSTNESDPNPYNNSQSETTTVQPYEVPNRAPSVDVSLVPAFKPCGTGGNPANAAHAPPLSVGSCDPPLPGSTVARVGPSARGWLFLDVVPGDKNKPGNQANVSIRGDVMEDVQTPLGVDYNPNPTGPDITLIIRLRLTDTLSGPSQSVPATATDLDFSVPIDCTTTPTLPSVGSNCGTATTANAVIPGAIQEGRYTVAQTFRVRLNDAGANGVPGDSDDRIFATQGVFVP
jgi:uncharacterized repeat protein (TIGR01451 family)